MKSISQIFEKDPELLNKKEVQMLVEYCQDLEEQLIEYDQRQKYSFENKLAEVVRDIYNSCITELSNDEESIRFKETERIDFKQGVINLKEYILKFAHNNNFRL